MDRAFPNRIEAGRQLAEKLEKYADRDDVIVLGLPRGGVPVAYEVAKRLRAPLDVFIVRKLGVPGFEELAAGAIASGGVRVLNQDVVRAIPHAEEAIEAVTVKDDLRLSCATESSFSWMTDWPPAQPCAPPLKRCDSAASQKLS